ncbi:MAG: TRAP transporter fused permease subunit [Paracoccaceae bacterium]
MKKLTDVMAALMTLIAVIWASDTLRLVGIAVYTEQYISLLLAFAFPLIFITIPARRSGEIDSDDDDEYISAQRRVPWYDLVAAGVGCALALYVMVRFPALSQMSSKRPLEGLIPAIVMLVLVLEGVRRSSGLIIAMVIVSVIGLAFVGHLLPAEISGRRIIPDHFAYFLLWDSTAILGPVLTIMTTIVVSFVFFGTVLFQSGGATFFTDASASLMGKYRGGQAKVSILGSSLFGSISGSVVANVVTTGVVTIPMMKKAGFRAQLAGAIEAVASTGGQLLPPVMGVTAFLMAEFLQVEYSAVALAALVPALMFYAALFIQADLEAARAQMRGLDPSEIPDGRNLLKSGWYFPIPFIVLIVALFGLQYRPETSALLATGSIVVTVLIFGYRGKRPSLIDWFFVFRDTGFKVLDIFMVAAGAGIVIATLNYTGLGFGLTLALVHLSGDNLVILLIIAALASIVLGMGMPTTGVYILLATLIAPALIQMGVEPMAAHLFILYFGCLSMITPPVAIGAFAAANIARADPLATGLEAVRFGWAVFIIPFLFALSPSLLLQGPPGLIAFDITTALAGVVMGAVGVIGYGSRRLGPVARIICILVAICLMAPLRGVAWGVPLNVMGIALALAIVAWEFLTKGARSSAGNA